MAVTQGLGDGFALYNGVKLPNIDSVWTDKVTYPYACILFYDNTTYCLFLSTGKLRKMASTLVGGTDGAIKGIQYQMENGSWSFLINRDFGETAGAMYAPAIWSSYDLNDTGGNLILAATPTIPLDGMQVIEWDGDTDGLANIDNYYKVSDNILDPTRDFSFTLVTSNRVTFSGANKDMVDIIAGSIAVYSTLLYSVYADNEYGFEKGLYFVKDTNGNYLSLLAYTPAAEPEQPKWQFNLRDFLSGAASAAASRGVLRRTPIAYLYNGVQLPGLPEWDKETYPYAWISKGQYSNQYTLHISTGLVNYRSWGDKGTLFYLYPISVPISVQQAYLSEDELDNGEWEFTWSKTYEENPVDSSSGFGLPIWSNFDVMNHYDSSTYLAASDPVPVYK